MFWRVAVVLVGACFVIYRVSLALEIHKARKAGDSEREQRLRAHGFGLHRWVVLCLLIVFVLLTGLFWLNSR